MPAESRAVCASVPSFLLMLTRRRTDTIENLGLDVSSIAKK
jgi:hypothetical protein